MKSTSFLFVLAALLLLAIPESRGATRTWSGLSSTTDFWSDSANWVGGTLPGPGDDVVFPTGVAQRTANNNLLTSLRSITFADGGYAIIGNNLTLTNGINATNTTGENAFIPLIVLGANQSFTNQNGGTELALINLDLHGKSATFGGAGTNLIANALEDTVGGGSLTNDGTGVFLFAGTNSNFTGPMALNGGTNIFTGFQQRSPITWTAGTLGGTGIVGNATASGVGGKLLTPGYLGGAGILITSNLVLNSAVTLVIHINGTNIPTFTQTGDYDRILTHGNITLGSAALNLLFTNNFSPPTGAFFDLIGPLSPADLVSGVFAGLPEGSTITNNNVVFQLSYNFGHGVTLTVTNVLSTGVTRQWSGGGANNLWSNPTNWMGNIPPNQGDALLFVDGFPQLTNFNDFPTGTTFDSIHFQSHQTTVVNMTLLGNSLRLNAGVVLEPASGATGTAGGTFIISNYISLANSQTFTNGLNAIGSIGGLHLAGGVAIGTNTLTAAVRTLNDTFFDAPFTGPGVFETDAGFNAFVILTASNAITGSIEVNQGVLGVRHAQALGSSGAGPVNVAANGTLALSAADTVFTASSVVLAGTLETFSTNTSLAAPLVVTGTNALIVGSGSMALLGPVTNSAQLRFNGTGGLILHVPAGAVVAGGGQLISQGHLNADGIIHNVVHLDSNIGGALSGAGQIDSVSATNFASITPGSFWDATLAYDPLGVGTLVMGNHAQLLVSLFPNRPGGGPTNTSLIVSNAPTLGQAFLNVTAQTNLTPNQQFTVIRNLDSAPVTNTFANGGEGVVFLPVNANLGVRISYAGGAGHDVVLTVQSNQPPVFAVLTNIVFFNVLSNNLYTNVISDFEQSAETFSWTNLTAFPTGLALNPNTGVISWAPTTNQAPSTNIIVVKVIDSGTPPMSTTGQVTIIVRPLNHAPVPVPVGTTNVLASHTLTIQLRANDPDNPPDTPIWGASSLPAGASLTSSGLFSFTPPANDGGTKSCAVYVYDFNPNDANPTSPTNSMTFNVQVIRNSIVVNTLDSGVGSLRWAITNASADPSGSRIEFNIPGTGPFRIAPLTPLPQLGDDTFIDGYTQPGAQLNTNTVGTGAKIMIELGGENIHADAGGLDASRASGIAIRGLCINSFTNNLGEAAILSSACFVLACTHGGITVEGCFIGTDTTGTKAVPNTLAINFGCACGCRIGGGPAIRNLISGNLSDAVLISGFGVVNMTIQDNLIGTDRTGTNALGNGGSGVLMHGLSGTSGCIVADNVIAANGRYGLDEAETSDLIVRNKIGVGADGVTPLGNGIDGILLNGVGNVVGGTNASDANIIAYNNGFGANIFGQNITVLGNSIFHNGSRAITLNTTAGANDKQSAPVLTNATANAGSLTINGTLASQSNTTYRIEFFHNPDFAPSNAPQAWIFLGATNITTGNSSNANFSVAFNRSISGGFLTATATDPSGNTSAISDGLALSLPQLGIALFGGQARVLWLTNFSAFVLQSNGSVIQPNAWGDVPGVPGITGSNFFRDFAPTGAPPRFFRLRSR